MKDCGKCSLCCKLIDVPGLAGAGEWCPNCKPGMSGGGCRIHDDRPSICLGYNCFWRAESWPDKFRPDKCKVIFEALPGVHTILISIDPSTPSAWKENNIQIVIDKLKSKGRPLVLKTKNGSEMFIPKGWDQQAVLKEIKQVIDWKVKNYGSTNIHD
jgi:hypothetical protein